MHVFGKRYLAQTMARCEGSVFNAMHAGRDVDIDQVGAAVKGTRLNDMHCGGNLDSGEADTHFKEPFVNDVNIGKFDFVQIATKRKGFGANIGNRIGKRKFHKAAATEESFFFDKLQVAGQYEGKEFNAIFKKPCTDGFEISGEVHIRQFITMGKGFFANGGDAFG